MYKIPKYDDLTPLDSRVLKQHIKRLLPEYVYNMSELEGNPFTFPEVQTLMDGITVGGHKLSDQNQVLRLRYSWDYVFDLSKSHNVITKQIFNDIHTCVAKGEALEDGVFRSGNVGISGTEYKPPHYQYLDEIFCNGIKDIYEEYENNNISLAIAIFLFGARNQFYWDGNKRTSRMVANLILIQSCQGVLNIKAKDKLEFNTLMVDFYNTGDGLKISEFLYRCIERP